MKIAPNAIEAFIKKPDAAYQAVLIYGPDSSLVNARMKALSEVVTDVNDPFNVVDISFDKIKDDAALLADEMAAISFTGGRRLIRISDMPAAMPADIKSVLKATKGDAFVIFCGGDFPPRSTARQYFEKEKNCAAVPCYKDDSRSLSVVIREALQKNGMTTDSDALKFLHYRFQADRQVVLNEIDKLVTYMGNEKHIRLADVEACIGESMDTSLDDVCNLLALNCREEVERVVSRMFREGIAPIAIIRALLRHFTRLYLVKSHMASGMDEGSALGKLRPPVFFKQAPLFKQQLRVWGEPQLAAMLQMLNKAELTTKTTGNPPEVVCRQLLAVILMKSPIRG